MRRELDAHSNMGMVLVMSRWGIRFSGCVVMVRSEMPGHVVST